MLRTLSQKSLIEWLVIAGVLLGLSGLLAHAIHKVSAAANQQTLAARSR
jgi:hypothetical protein